MIRKRIARVGDMMVEMKRLITAGSKLAQKKARTEKTARDPTLQHNFIKEVNTWVFHLLIYSRPFIKYTRNKLRQIDQKTKKRKKKRKLITTHRKLRKRLKFSHITIWYKQKSESTRGNETYWILWDFEIRTGHLISARKSIN